MSGSRILLSILLAVFLSLGFIAGCGCGSSSDSGGGDSSTGSITGTVTNLNLEPVSGALCTVTTTGAKTDYSDYTDESGVYEISGVPEGSWTFTVTADGYASQTMDVTVTGGQTTENPSVEMSPAGYGIITGTVLSASDGSTVIPGTTVSCGRILTTSGSNGAYTLADVPAGSQNLTATASGYVNYNSVITVIADSTITKDIAMTSSSTASPTPSPGYGNVAGKVADSNGTGIADVTVTLQKGGKAVTDSAGSYLVENLSPGVRTLSYAKTGYDSKTQDVTVEADTTVTAATVTLTSTAAVTTKLVSKRINLPETGNSESPDVSDDGSRVVFHSKGNVISTWNSPADVWQIYLWSSDTGAITRLSNNNLVSGSTAGGNKESQFPAISGDGKYVVFRSQSTDILADGLASNAIQDGYLVRISDNKTVRLTSDAADSNNCGNSATWDLDINGDGTAVAISTQSSNIGNIAHTAGFLHVYYVKISNMTPGVRRMLDITTASTEGTNGGANPFSYEAAISWNGRHVSFRSIANNITSAGAGVPAGGLWQVYRTDTTADPASGWNILISTHNGNVANQSSTTPAINQDGTRIAFSSAATNLGNSSATAANIYMWTSGSTALKWVSIPLAGQAGANLNPTMDNTGRYVGFTSATVGLVSDVTNNTHRIYVKDMDSSENAYTLVSRGASGQVPDQICDAASMSGDGNYVVWHTTAKNLTNDDYTTGIRDIFIRKWK